MWVEKGQKTVAKFFQIFSEKWPNCVGYWARAGQGIGYIMHNPDRHTTTSCPLYHRRGHAGCAYGTRATAGLELAAQQAAEP